MNLKQKLTLGLKVSFVAALLYFLIVKGFISGQAMHQAFSQWKMLLLGIGALVLSALLGVFRWQWLLQAQGIHLPWSRTFQLTLIGNFFNIALPGAVSGDFIKAFYVGKEAHGKRTRAFGSILFDRVAGVSALVLVSAGAIAFGIHTFMHSPLLGAIQLLVKTAAACVIVFYGYLFLVRERHDPLLRVFKWIEIKIPKLTMLTHIYESLRHYHNHRKTVLNVLALSAVIHILCGWACFQFLQALGEPPLPLLSVYVVVPLGLLLTAIPVAPAGIGTGNIAFLYFFHLIGSERGADIYSLYALGTIIIGALGGLVYLRFRSQSPAHFALAVE